MSRCRRSVRSLSRRAVRLRLAKIRSSPVSSKTRRRTSRRSPSPHRRRSTSRNPPRHRRPEEHEGHPGNHRRRVLARPSTRRFRSCGRFRGASSRAHVLSRRSPPAPYRVARGSRPAPASPRSPVSNSPPTGRAPLSRAGRHPLGHRPRPAGPPRVRRLPMVPSGPCPLLSAGLSCRVRRRAM